jgi:septal ring factor EnvC (AmiA/AmiB activator)
MTRPVHTVQYMQTGFKKYQILAILCAVLTAIASLLAAFSGMQISALKKSQSEAAASNKISQKQREEAATQAQESLRQQLATAQEHLNAERQAAKNLHLRIGDLERRLATAESKLSACQQKAAAPRPEPTASGPEEKKNAPPSSQGGNGEASAPSTGLPEKAPTDQ